MKNEMEVIRRLVDETMSAVFLEHKNINCKIINDNVDILELRIKGIISSLAVGSLFADNNNKSIPEDAIHYQDNNHDSKLIIHLVQQITGKVINEAGLDDDCLQNIIACPKDFKFQLKQIFKNLSQE